MFIDVEELLLREKATTQEPLFVKTNLHLTQVGQLPVVKEIVARIAEAERRHNIKWNEKLTLVHSRGSGGSQDRFMSVLLPVKEVNPYY
jgi:hypothetical protein